MSAAVIIRKDYFSKMKNIGKIVQIIGPVIDVKFENGHLPNLLNAIEIEHEGRRVVCEVANQLGDDVVRCIAMSSTDGMSRGMDAVDTGAGITVPVGEVTLGQEMVLRGEVAPEDARTHEKKNVITRAVGADKKIDIDFFEVELLEKDTVLMCTDGLTNMLTDDKIHQIIMAHVDAESTCKTLVEEANKSGGTDNITTIVMKPFYEEVKVC